MNSRELSVLSASLLILAAGTCLSLAVTVARRAGRRAEVNALLPAFALLGVQYLALGSGRLLGEAIKVVSPGALFLLLAGGELLGLLCFALCAHFMTLARRDAAQGAGEENSTPPPGGPGKRPPYGALALGVYGPLLLAAAGYAWAAVRAPRARDDWDLGPPPTPFSAAGGDALDNLPGVVAWGYFVGFALLMQSVVLAERCPRRQGWGGGSRLRRLATYLFVDAMKPPAGNLAAAGDGAPAGTSAFLRARELNALVALINGVGVLMWIFLFSRLAGSGQFAREVVRISYDLWPLHLAFLLLCYRTRLVFLDAIVKRSALAAAPLGAGAAAAAAALAWLPGDAAAPVAVGAGVAGFAACRLACHRRLGRALDRYFFLRPDFGRLAAELGDEMRRCADAEALLDRVATRIQEAFGADYVRHAGRPAGDPPDGMTAEVALEADGRRWGFFVCGPRRQGQLYLSEDLAFLAAVGAQVAGMLSNFALREEREARSRREAELRELAARAELRVLHAQINPHFLYNALNSLADLTRDDPRLAERTVLDLARIFRFALDASRREGVTLGEEADFIEAYLRVERVRFEGRLSYRLRIPGVLRDLRVPPMLIQPLVENAVRHGITPKPEGGSVKVSARLDRGRLRVRVADDGVGFDPAVSAPGAGNGFGLANVRARVELLSGPGHWVLNSTPGAGTVIEFDVVMKPAGVIEAGLMAG